MKLQILMLFLAFGLSALSAWYILNALNNVCAILHQLVGANNFVTCWTGWERWNLGMASDKPIVQLASAGSSNWKENHLYAWWYRSIYKSCGTDWESSASNYNGSRLNCAYGFIVVSECLSCFSLVCDNVRESCWFINDILICFPLRSDPTENDSVEGLRPNARGPGLVTFGVSLVFFFMKHTTFQVYVERSVLWFMCWYIPKWEYLWMHWF